MHFARTVYVHYYCKQTINVYWDWSLFWLCTSPKNLIKVACWKKEKTVFLWLMSAGTLVKFCWWFFLKDLLCFDEAQLCTFHCFDRGIYCLWTGDVSEASAHIFPHCGNTSESNNFFTMTYVFMKIDLILPQHIRKIKTHYFYKNYETALHICVNANSFSLNYASQI